MKKNIAVSLLILLMASFSLGGFTVAWFTSESGAIQNIFTAGTVEISEPVLTSSGQLSPGTTADFAWDLQSTGSKGIYLRVRPSFATNFSGSTELSAWLEGTFIKPGLWHGQCFEYVKGAPTLHKDFLMGKTAEYAGHGEVWTEGDTLYIQYHMAEGWCMEETQVYAGLEFPSDRVPGNFPFQYYFDSEITEFLLQTDYVLSEYGGYNVPLSTVADGTTLYLGVHVRCYDMGEFFTCSLEPTSTSWMEGSDGWWYYGTAAGPTRIEPGQTVSVEFAITMSEDFSGSLDISLEAEAVQASNNAIHYVWPSNPWN